MTRAPLDRRALGRALSLLANAGPQQLLARAHPACTHEPAQRVGLTGPPGAGKSTLAGRLGLHRAAAGTRRVAVLAVDPSSPRSGGAILGDRIRMDELPDSVELYIRSVGSRTTSDGLSDNLPEMLELLDEHGFDDILLETVGVGQAEYAARTQVDTLVLVLLPESGDIVQAMKAGIMEMADILVVNKADLPGAPRMVADIRRIASITRVTPGAWRPPVLLTSASQPESVAALSEAVDAHREWLDTAGRRPALLESRARYRLQRLIERLVSARVAALDTALLAMPIDSQVRRVLQELNAGA